MINSKSEAYRGDARKLLQKSLQPLLGAESSSVISFAKLSKAISIAESFDVER